MHEHQIRNFSDYSFFFPRTVVRIASRAQHGLPDYATEDGQQQQQRLALVQSQRGTYVAVLYNT